MKIEKSILNREKRENHPLNGARLIFKWTVSRGRETYGYNICTLYIQRDWNNIERAARCNGGGYDMRGACLGEFLKANFSEELKTLPAQYGSLDHGRGFYGLSFYDKASKARPCRGYRAGFLRHWRPGCSIHLDGACGMMSMESILAKIGFQLKYLGKYPGDSSNSEYQIVAK